MRIDIKTRRAGRSALLLLSAIEFLNGRPGGHAATGSGRLDEEIAGLAEQVEAGFASLPAESQRPVGVGDFVYGESNQVGPGGRAVAQELFAQLRARGHLPLVPREDLEKALAEAGRSMADLYDPRAREELTGLPDFLLLGSISDMGRESLRIFVYLTARDGQTLLSLFLSAEAILDVKKVQGSPLYDDYQRAHEPQREVMSAEKALRGGLAVNVKYSCRTVPANQESVVYLQVEVGNADHCSALRRTEAEERERIVTAHADHLRKFREEVEKSPLLPLDLRHRLLEYALCECPLECRCQGGLSHGCNCGMDGCEAIDPRKFLDKCPPLNLALVVDTSSSMGVEVPGCPMAKLHHVKEGLKHVLKYLKEGDLVSLVSFADDATVILPPTEAVSHRHEITEAIEGLEAQGTTNLYEGLRRGAEMVRQNRRTLNRILLFTDGQPTSGIVDPDAITALAWNLFQPGPETDNGPRDLGTPDPESGISSPVVRGPWSPQADGLAVSLSVFGVGYNDLADRLLMEMTDARAGNAGSLHYINEMPMIGQMVFHDLLQVLLARQTTLEIELAGGARALETGLFLEKASETRLKGFLRHIDVYGTKTATALLWVPPTPAGSVPLGTLTVTYYDPDNRLCQEQLRLGLLSIAGPRADADPEDGSVTMTYQLQRARKSLGEALMADAPSTALEQLLDDQIQLDFGQIHLTDSLISWYI